MNSCETYSEESRVFFLVIPYPILKVWVFGHLLCGLSPVSGPWGRAKEAELIDPVDAAAGGELLPEVRAGVTWSNRGKAQARLFLWREKCEQGIDQACSSSICQCNSIRKLAGI